MRTHHLSQEVRTGGWLVDMRMWVDQMAGQRTNNTRPQVCNCVAPLPVISRNHQRLWRPIMSVSTVLTSYQDDELWFLESTAAECHQYFLNNTSHDSEGGGGEKETYLGVVGVR